MAICVLLRALREERSKMYQSIFKHFAAQFMIAVLLFGTIANIAIAQKVETDSLIPKDELTGTHPCVEGDFKTTGNSNVTGPAGNIRTFSNGNVNVKASAFARQNSNGAWQTAYLGAYGPGLGVTDSSEDGNNNTHKVDNAGNFKNYVLFEFDQQVVVDRVDLAAITTDSDMTAWIGNSTDPYNNHITLNDALLAGFGSENNNGTGTNDRTADINAGGEVGNVLIVAARPDQSDDWFKVGGLHITCPPPPCAVTDINTTGNDNTTDGADGNVRTFTSGSISVKASAFSRKNTDGLWETGYLGDYSPGLGVTDRGEGNGDNNRHKVDNIGDRKNYVLFEFNRDVVVDRVYLDAVGDAIGTDSDITVWIGNGTDPYNNHLTLSDALLASFEPREDNNTTSTSARWADINAAGKTGNVLVVAASTSDLTPEDAFKIGHIEVRCSDHNNRATVTIIKEVTPFGGGSSSSQAFNFTATGLGASSFNLVDLNVPGPDRFINANITSFGSGNPIMVTESALNGWTLADIACSETGGIANTTVNFGQRKANIIAEPGESITCIFKNTQLAPSAAHASVLGRAVTADGMGISGAVLTLTNINSGEVSTARSNMFGYYSFEDLEVGAFYVVTIQHKRYFFSQDTRSFTLVDDLTSLDFVETF